MTIKSNGGIFGRNPTFNNVTVDGTLTVDQIVEKTGAAGITLDGVTLKDGNVVLANGKGIDFSATPGTGTSELFDDYERGTWTPGFSGGGLSGITYGTATGVYTKIGNVVSVWFRVSTLDTFTATSGGISVSGLPFTVSSTPARAALCLHDSTRWTSSPPLTGRVVGSTTTIALVSSFAITGAFTSPTQTNSTNMINASGVNNVLEGSLTYYT